MIQSVGILLYNAADSRVAYAQIQDPPLSLCTAQSNLMYWPDILCTANYAFISTSDQ